jgi:hypothetical protein
MPAKNGCHAVAARIGGR